MPSAGEVEAAELDTDGPVASVDVDPGRIDGDTLIVPGAELDGGLPLLVELGEPQPLGPIPPDSEGEGLPGPVAVPSVVGAALDEGMVIVVTSTVVRSVICVVDSLVAIVAI